MTRKKECRLLSSVQEFPGRAQRVFILIFFLLGASFCYADKFGSSLSEDSLTKDTTLKISSTPVVAQTASLPATPAVQQSPAVSTPAISVPVSRLPDLPQLQSSAIHTLPTAIDLKKIKISVPDFETQFEKLLQAKEEKGRKRRKAFMDSIAEEIRRYGLITVLILVLLVVLYAIHKEKIHPSHPEQTEKKTLWDDEF